MENIKMVKTSIINKDITELFEKYEAELHRIETEIISEKARELRTYYLRIGLIIQLYNKLGLNKAYIENLQKICGSKTEAARDYNRTTFNAIKKCYECELHDHNTIFRHVDQDLNSLVLDHKNKIAS